MLSIQGIDSDKVERYGKNFLQLIREAKQWYEEMMGDRPPDPNHQNVICLSSDEEFGGFEALDDLDGDDGSDNERSAYFQPPAEVEAFNAHSKSSCASTHGFI